MEMTTAQDSRQYAEEVASRCSRIAKKIAVRGQRARARRTLLRVIAALVGVSAVVVAYVPDVTALVGNAASYFSLAAAVTLILGSLAPMLDPDNSPPERYADFARYIDYYDGRLREILSDESLSNNVRMARLREVNNLAIVNVNDVKSMWPWVEPDQPAA